MIFFFMDCHKQRRESLRLVKKAWPKIGVLLPCLTMANMGASQRSFTLIQEEPCSVNMLPVCSFKKKGMYTKKSLYFYTGRPSHMVSCTFFQAASQDSIAPPNQLLSNSRDRKTLQSKERRFCVTQVLWSICLSDKHCSAEMLAVKLWERERVQNKLHFDWILVAVLLEDCTNCTHIHIDVMF